MYIKNVAYHDLYQPHTQTVYTFISICQLTNYIIAFILEICNKHVMHIIL